MTDLLTAVLDWLTRHDLLHLCGIAMISMPAAAWMVRDSLRPRPYASGVRRLSVS